MANREIKIKVKGELTGIDKLNRQLKDVKGELIDALSMDNVDPAKIEELTAEAARLKDTLADVNEQVDVFATGSKYEVVSNSLGAIGDGIANLDFDKASERANAFAIAAKKISFKDAIGSVKSLGKTFVSVGRALLTNPLFLLGTIIGVIVVAVYKFLDSIGFIEKALDLLMIPLNFLIDGLKKLSDWLGFSSFAAEEAAQKKADAYEEAAKSIESSTQDTIRILDNEIRMAKLNGKNTEEMERQKIEAVQRSLEKRVEADEAALESAELTKKLTKEEIAELKEKVRQSKIAYGQTIEDLKYFDAQREKMSEETTKKEKDKEDKDRKDRLNKQKEYNKNRLSVSREIEDLEINQITDETEKALKLNETKYKRLIEDTLKNETILLKEKQKIVKLLQEEQTKQDEEIKKAKSEKDKKDLEQATQEYNDLLLSLNENSFIIEKANIENEQKEKLDILKKQLEEKQITQQQFNEAELLLEEEKKRKLKELSMSGADGEMSPIEQAQFESEELLRIEREKLEAGLIDQEEFNSRRKEIERNLQNFIREQEEQTKQERIAAINTYLSTANSGLSAISSLMDASMDAEIAKAEGNEKKQESLRKKAFEKRKKMEIAAAIMGMAQGVIAGLGAPFPLNIALPVIAGITGLAQISKIKSTQYSGGGGSGGSSSGGGGGGASMPSNTSAMNRSMPTANFMGQGNDQNSVGAGGSDPQEIYIYNDVSVSESEISRVQKKNKQRKENAEL